LRSAYRAYIAGLSANDCGKAMAEQLPSVTVAKARCNRLLGKLAKLDPDNAPCTSIA
jgi:hypothetical protein